MLPICKLLSPHTHSEHDVDTVTFTPTVVPFPQVTTNDFIKQAALDIVSILTNPLLSTSITLETGDDVKNALLKIAEILQRIELTPALPPLTPFLTPIPSTKITPMPVEANLVKDTVLQGVQHKPTWIQ